MISKERVSKLILDGIEGSDTVLVDVKVSPSNQIKILLDSFIGVTIDRCVEISRLVENGLNREEEDFELEVSSYGLGQDFSLPLHYLKNINRKIEVHHRNGGKILGVLKKVKLTEDKKNIESIEILNIKKVKLEGKKKKVEQEEIKEVAGSEILKAKLVPVF